ncbi:hypothetical protein J3Q64DRAFT_1827873 [Phycomyces blakesleeanus]|uniref:WH2 domain-containing protein n=1 Tax=Phycomyces blakesleeanus TaxID=4837 RepID=A0ABR3BF76_PHYBL
MDNGLLAQIQKGKQLKKATTNDRSAPIANGPPAGGMARPPVPSFGNSSASAPTNTAPMATPPLAGLFANGMPSLRKAKGTAINTGRESSPATTNTSAAPVPRPPPTFNRPPVPQANSNTLPRSFTSRPFTARNTFTPPSNAPPPPPPPPPSAGNNNTPATGGPPPPPPPPPGAGGIPPSFKSSFVPSLPGRARSNSSPQRPVPPTPPRAVPAPPASPTRTQPMMAPPVRPSPMRPHAKTSLAVPPPLPPGRPRSASTNVTPAAPPPPPPQLSAAQTVGGGNIGNGAPPPPPPPPPPPSMATNSRVEIPRPPVGRASATPSIPAPSFRLPTPTAPNFQSNNNYSTPPPPPPPPPGPSNAYIPPAPAARLPSPPSIGIPPPPPPPSGVGIQRGAPGMATPPRSPLPPPPSRRVQSFKPSAPSTPRGIVSDNTSSPEPPLTQGRYTFRPSSALPQPRSCSHRHHVYPSGAIRGNGKFLNFPIKTNTCRQRNQEPQI